MSCVVETGNLPRVGCGTVLSGNKMLSCRVWNDGLGSQGCTGFRRMYWTLKDILMSEGCKVSSHEEKRRA